MRDAAVSSVDTVDTTAGTVGNAPIPDVMATADVPTVTLAGSIVGLTEEVITVVQAADMADVSDTTIRVWMKKGIVEWTRRDGYSGALIIVSSLCTRLRSMGDV